MTYDFDLFVIGAGSGGIATARQALNMALKWALPKMIGSGEPVSIVAVFPRN